MRTHLLIKGTLLGQVSDAVCDQLDLRPTQVWGESTSHKMCTARWYVYTILYKHYGMNRYGFAKLLERSHHSVYYGIQQMAGFLDCYPSYKEEYDAITGKLPRKEEVFGNPMVYPLECLGKKSFGSVLMEVCLELEVHRDDVLGNCRRWKYVKARWIAFHILHSMCGVKIMRIADAFKMNARRVYHGVEKMEQLLKMDLVRKPELEMRINKICAKLAR